MDQRSEAPRGSASKVVFLDRDGVLNVEIGDYVTRVEDLRMEAGAAESVARLTKAGWTVFVFTNQGGVGRGRMPLVALEEIHARLRSEIEAAGGSIRAIYACIHHPDAGCDCRKPKAGLLKQAASEHAIDLTGAFIIGDSPRDIEAGVAVGAETILVLTGKTKTYEAGTFPSPQPRHVFESLRTATDWLLALTP